MNFVYVLISNEDDMYLENTIISIMSVKKHNPEANIFLLTDKTTHETFYNKRACIYSLGINIILVDIPACYDKKNRSRYLKTSMNRFFSEDFLFIDADTVICDNLEEVFSFDIKIGCVLDKHYILNQHPLRRDIEKRTKQSGYHAGYCGKHFNSGVMFVKSCEESTELFELWHKLWKAALRKNVTQDQTALNEANFRLGGIITELEGAWNCQLANRTAGWQYVYGAHIIHYFAGYGDYYMPYDLADKKILMKIYDEPMDETIAQILDNPKTAFKTVSCIMCNDNDAILWDSTLFSIMRRLCRKQGMMFRGINKFLDGIKIIRKKILNKLKKSNRRLLHSRYF